MFVPCRTVNYKKIPCSQPRKVKNKGMFTSFTDSLITTHAQRLKNLRVESWNVVAHVQRYYHMVRHLGCVFINYNWINQLSNTTIWWSDICCLLDRYQLHISALMAIFKLIDSCRKCNIFSKTNFFQWSVRMVFVPSLLSIENEIIKTLNYNDVIRECAFNRDRKFP